MLIVLEGERPISWNTLYAGKHWKTRATIANRAHETVWIALRQQHPNFTPFENRVRITVRAYFKNRPLDPCNIPAKIYIDGLLGVVIEDDHMKYVAGVTVESHIDKYKPRIEIEITEVKE